MANRAKRTGVKSAQASQRASAKSSLGALFSDFRLARFRHAASARKDHYLRELREAYLHRGLVLYVGAGVSRSLGLPSWPEMIRALSVMMMSRRVETAIDALETLSDEHKFKLLERLQVQVEQRADSDKPILLMARAVKDELGNQLPLAIARTLYRPVFRQLALRWRDEAYLKHRRVSASWRGEPFLRSTRLLPASDLLDAIVALCRAERDVHGVQGIVNYNYDDLLDEKLREQHVRCKTILSGRDVVPVGTLPSYHVHGLISSKDVATREVPRVQGNFVFSEDEYHAEYSDPYKWSNMTQMSLLGRYAGLFVGLSLEDPNIRRLIDVTHRQYPENVNYAILPRKNPLKNQANDNDAVMRNLFEEVESNSLERIGVRVLWVDAYGEIPSLLNGICEAQSAGQ